MARRDSAKATVEIPEEVIREFGDWFDIWRNIDRDVRPDRFTVQGRNTFAWSPAESLSVYSSLHSMTLNDRFPLLARSPDSMKALDPYLTWDGGFDADVGVAMIDFRDSTWGRLMYCGTPCSFEGAVWITGSSFAVVESRRERRGKGTTEAPDSSIAFPLVHIFDLFDSSRTVYAGPSVPESLYEKSGLISYAGGRIQELLASRHGSSGVHD